MPISGVLTMTTQWKTIDAFKIGTYQCERCGTDNEFVTKLETGEFVCIDCLEDHEWKDPANEN